MRSLRNYLLIIIGIISISCSDTPDGMTLEKIPSKDIVAKLLSRPENLQAPLVIVVPGSGGSFIPNKTLFGLTESGYDVLSIAYFGERNLPKKMEKIPLEYLEKVVLWSKNKFPKRKIILLGISKGAEYSLAFASYFDLVDGVIAYTPSAFVLPNHIDVKENEPLVSSWTLQGKEVPFASIDRFTDKAGKIVYKKYIDPIFENIAVMEQSRIKVENIHCNVLLLTGEDDWIWPASQMADYMKTTFEKENTPYTMDHISYQDCGHQFLWFDDTIPTERAEYQSTNLTGIKKHKFLYGGTQEGTLKAMVASRKAVVAFLDAYNN